mgnify:CR=1 FL=1
MQTFGERLRMFRDERGLTQDGLAQISGFKLRTIQCLESGNGVGPQKIIVERLAAALGIHHKDLWPRPILPEERGTLGPLSMICLECRNSVRNVRGVCLNCRKKQIKFINDGKSTDAELVRQGRLEPIKRTPWRRMPAQMPIQPD